MTARSVGRPLLFRVGVLVAVAAIAFVRCGTIAPGAATGHVSKVGGSTVASSPVPGVTAATVKVAFIGVNLVNTEKTLGFNTPNPGPLAKEVQALQNYVNAHGGIAGRKADFIYVNYEASLDSPAFEESTCDQITQDDQVFAVMMMGQFENNVRQCYANAHTLMLDETLTPSSQQLYQQLAPYLWSPDYPSANAFTATFINALHKDGFFTGVTKVGFVSQLSSGNEQIWNTEAKPLLARYGVTGDIVYINSDNISDLDQGLVQAAIKFRTDGVSRVSFLGGSRLASFFMTVAAAQRFTARYAVSSYDNPSFLALNPSTIPSADLDGMIGLGFDPSQEVTDSPLAWPATPGETQCLDIMKGAGISFAGRQNMQNADLYCDAALLLQDGAKSLGSNLSAATWAAAVHGLGTSFDPASGFATNFSGENFAGASAYRLFAWVPKCGCFEYTTGDEPFVSP